nr:MAG TPA: hypothetical protein [Caudoviricetes sp.]
MQLQVSSSQLQIQIPELLQLRLHWMEQRLHLLTRLLSQVDISTHVHRKRH